MDDDSFSFFVFALYALMANEWPNSILAQKSECACVMLCVMWAGCDLGNVLCDPIIYFPKHCIVIVTAVKCFQEIAGHWTSLREVDKKSIIILLYLNKDIKWIYHQSPPGHVIAIVIGCSDCVHGTGWWHWWCPGSRHPDLPPLTSIPSLAPPCLHNRRGRFIDLQNNCSHQRRLLSVTVALFSSPLH